MQSGTLFGALSAFQVGIGDVGEGGAHGRGFERVLGAAEIHGMGTEAIVHGIRSLVEASPLAGSLEHRSLYPLAQSRQAQAHAQEG